MYSEDYTRQTAVFSAQKALDPDLTDHDLATMARSEEAKVRATVAERIQTPLTIILRLSEDESPVVRAGVARNKRVDMPHEVYQELMRDKSLEVLFALIRNDAVPDKLIAKLARSRDKDVAAAVRKRLAAKGTKAKVLGIAGFATS